MPAKMKSFLTSGIEVRVALAEAGAGQAAVADGEQALHDLVALALVAAPRVDPDVDAVLHVAEEAKRDVRRAAEQKRPRGQETSPVRWPPTASPRTG